MPENPLISLSLELKLIYVEEKNNFEVYFINFCYIKKKP